MKKKLKERLNNNEGQAIVELAIILPIILLIIMIIVYLGIFTFSKCVVLLSAHEGGREALLIWNTEMTQQEKEVAIREAVAKGLDSLPNGDDSEIVIIDDNVGTIDIEAKYYFKLNLPFISQILDSDSITVKSNVTYKYATAPGEGNE